jgi:PAS domain S-box-containing protein
MEVMKSVPDVIESLQRELASQAQLNTSLQRELDETNRGVVKLYAELDIQAEQLKRSESKFQAIYAQAPCGIALVDAHGLIVEANSAMSGLLGSTQLTGTRLSGFAHADSRAALDALIAHEGIAKRQEVLFEPRNAEAVHLELSLTPNVERGIAMIVAVDVSQRVSLEQRRLQWLDRERAARTEAENDSRSKDDVMSVLAHELRTPLNAIVGWTFVLKKSTDPNVISRGLGAIERNTEVQSRMIADLLDISRLRLGKLAMTFETVDPQAVVTAAVDTLRPTFEEKGIAVRIGRTQQCRPIQADASRLQQVLWNLLTNSIKFSPAGTAVEVDMTEENDRFVVAVTDHGQGMSPDLLPKVFDRFAQNDPAQDRKKGGLGLGLAIVKQIVEAHGGRVEVSSAGPGMGSTFRIRLPFRQTGAADIRGPESERTPEDDPLQGLDVVIVDDDTDAASVLSIVLRDRGANVRAARDADGCLALISVRRPDILISDIGMPSKDGYDLIRELRAKDADRRSPHLPAIALTSFLRDKDRQDALSAGFDAHCAKPLKPHELIRQVDLLVADRQSSRRPSIGLFPG